MDYYTNVIYQTARMVIVVDGYGERTRAEAITETSKRLEGKISDVNVERVTEIVNGIWDGAI